MIRYVDAEGETLSEMRENARNSDLYCQGDMKLVWVNEGDLSAQQFRAAAQPINWRDDPAAIVEDDEPMVGRDYA
jgi:hypothetical protein